MKAFALVKHAGQTYGDLPHAVPYFHHLKLTERVLVIYGYDTPEARAAALGHDLIEDCGVTKDEIAAVANTTVANRIMAVSMDMALLSRKERLAEVYPRILAEPGAVELKQADRIVNMEYGLAMGSSLLARYVKEWPGFRSALSPKGDPDMWARLEHLVRLAEQAKGAPVPDWL